VPAAVAPSIKPSDPPETATLRALRAASAADRPELLTRVVCECLADVMGLDGATDIDAEARLFDRGMDSIMAIALQDALEAELCVTLSATLVFNHPTARAIVTFLLEEILTFEADGGGAPAGDPERPKAADEGIDSDPDLLREAQRLDEKLAQLSKWIDS
jgi:acyl carrier protein